MVKTCLSFWQIHLLLQNCFLAISSPVTFHITGAYLTRSVTFPRSKVSLIQSPLFIWPHINSTFRSKNQGDCYRNSIVLYKIILPQERLNLVSKIWYFNDFVNFCGWKRLQGSLEEKQFYTIKDAPLQFTVTIVWSWLIKSDHSTC